MTLDLHHFLAPLLLNRDQRYEAPWEMLRQNPEYIRFLQYYAVGLFLVTIVGVLYSRYYYYWWCMESKPTSGKLRLGQFPPCCMMRHRSTNGEGGGRNSAYFNIAANSPPKVELNLILEE